MSKRMKTNAAKKTGFKDDSIKFEPVEKLEPDISSAVESVCTRLNTIIMIVKDRMNKLGSFDFSTGQVSVEQFNSIVDTTEELLESARSKYTSFHKECKDVLSKGWKINSFARTCLHMTDQATKNALIDFDEARSSVLLKFYDSAPANVVKATKAPRFGNASKHDIDKHIYG